MTTRQSNTRRTIAIALVAGVILVGLVLATGGGFSTSSNPQNPGAPPPPKGQATSTTVRASTRVVVRHLRAHTYTFTYTVRNQGTMPISGFQLNGSPAHLYQVRGPTGWNAFGSGVCGGHYPGVLVYWSTGVGGILPGKANGFSFFVNTSGSAQLQYSLAQGTSVFFGHITGPRPSALAGSGTCSGQGSH